MRILKCLILFVAAIFVMHAAPLRGQTPRAAPPNCAADSAFHVLDFWIGNWSVIDSTGAQVGTNRIEKILDGCAVTETWRDASGEGRSLFYYVPEQRQWKQVWVTPNALSPGGLKEKHLIAQSAVSVRFQGEVVGPRGGLVLDRTTLSTMSGGRVRQVIEISRDGGSSWRVAFDAIYVPVKTAP
jgi:hypothetical protein